MKSRLSVLTLSAGLALIHVPALAQTPRAQPNASAVQFADRDRLAKLSTAFPEIDRIMAAFAEREKVPGIAYGISVDGKVVHIGTAGFRELSSRSPVESSSVFRIASMTKSFTALAILKLRDEGRLSLDHPAERYVAELSALRYPSSDAPKITIRHLLSHSAGFPEDNPWGDQQLADTEEELSAMLRGGILFSTAPGTAYEYSNLGFAILGRIITNVSGIPYKRYITRQILEPLGMRGTRLEAAEVPAERLAHGYRWQDSAWLEEKQLPDGAFGSMGGMLTSVSDLGRWVAFMIDAWPPRDGVERGPVRRSSVREMQQIARYNGALVFHDTATRKTTLNAGGYGFGLGISQTCAFPTLVSHSGGLPGFGSLMRWLPKYGVGIVALGNLTYTPWGRAIPQAVDALAATGGLVPRIVEPAPVLTMRRDQVSRLVANWSEALADTIAAMNLYLDESKTRRRDAIEALRLKAGGGCQNEGPFAVGNALRGRWRMRCRDGDLRVAITLAPPEPGLVQFLDVAPIGRTESLAALSACR